MERINNFMKKDDSKLIWESYTTESEEIQKEELDRGDEAGDYINFLKNYAEQSGGGSEAMENVLSHPFEETYGEYLRTKSTTGVYTAAKAHIQLAERMKVYHEVDLQDLDNWKYS